MPHTSTASVLCSPHDAILELSTTENLKQCECFLAVFCHSSPGLCEDKLFFLPQNWIRIYRQQDVQNMRDHSGASPDVVTYLRWESPAVFSVPMTACGGGSDLPSHDEFLSERGENKLREMMKEHLMHIYKKIFSVHVDVQDVTQMLLRQQETLRKDSAALQNLFITYFTPHFVIIRCLVFSVL